MMKEWAEARQHVQDLKSVDPKGAEKLNKEITAVRVDSNRYMDQTAPPILLSVVLS